MYLAAVQLGTAPVSKVSQTSEVRREDTYRALAKLEKIGLVERIRTMNNPVQVRAQPAEEALSILMKNWKESNDRKEVALTQGKEAFLKYLKASKKLRLVEEESHFALLLEKDVVFRRVADMVKTAEKEIDAVSSAEEIPNALLVLSETLRKPSYKQLKVRLILEAPHEEKPLLASLGKHLSPDFKVELKYAYKPLSHYIIVDFKKVLLATAREPSIGKLPYLWTNTYDFAQLLQRHFEELWQASKKPGDK